MKNLPVLTSRLWTVGVALFFGTVAALAAQPALVLDLLTVSPSDGTVRWVYGSEGLGIWGLPVAGGEDCDGDGFNDYAVAHMIASPFGRNEAGIVDLVFGDGTIGGEIDTAVPNTRVLRFAGAGPQEATGSEIWIEDVTGDGVGDLLIARQNYSEVPGRIGSGALTIVAGGAELATQAATLQTVDLAAPPAALSLTTLIGANALDRLGIWVRTGDMTGDGIADLAIGADQEDGGVGEVNRGAVWLVRGGAHLAGAGEIDLASFGTTSFAGNLAKVIPPRGAENYHLGATVTLADLDGNGRSELLAAATLARVGAFLDPPGAPNSAVGSGGAPDGTVYIVWDDNLPAGAWSAGLTLDLETPTGSVTQLNGGQGNVRFGEELAAGFDADNDGLVDLFAGDLLGDGTLGSRPTSGLGWILYGAQTLKGREIDLDLPPPDLRFTRILGADDEHIGADTAAIGDFDGDSLDDLMISSPHASPKGRHFAGIAYVLYGRPGGWPAEIDLAPASYPTPAEVRIAEIQGGHGTITGVDGGDTLAYSAAAGDLDGDGRTDLIANEMVGNGISPGTIDVGNLIVVAGKALVGSSIFADGFDSGDTADWSTLLVERDREDSEP